MTDQEIRNQLQTAILRKLPELEGRLTFLGREYQRLQRSLEYITQSGNMTTAELARLDFNLGLIDDLMTVGFGQLQTLDRRVLPVTEAPNPCNRRKHNDEERTQA